MKLLGNIILFPLTLLRFLAVILVTIYVGIVGWFWLTLSGFSRRLQKWAMLSWGKAIVFICGIKIDRNELPKTDNFILMPNHRSYLDIFIVAGLTPAAMVGKAEVGKWPFGKLAVKLTNSILVDRKDSKSLIDTMRRIKSSVDQGIPVVLFPEGATYKGPLTKAFKKGSFKIAADSGIPIIPMAIDYKDKEDAWIDDDTLVRHFFRQMNKPRTKVSIRYGKPITSNDLNVLREKTKTKIEKMLTDIQTN